MVIFKRFQRGLSRDSQTKEVLLNEVHLAIQCLLVNYYMSNFIISHIFSANEHNVSDLIQTYKRAVKHVLCIIDLRFINSKLLVLSSGDVFWTNHQTFITRLHPSLFRVQPVGRA